MVLDDDQAIGQMIKDILEFKGFSVVAIERSAQMEPHITDNRFDLFIIDMLLSGENGIDVCFKLKQNEKTASIPIMMISASPEAKEKCLHCADDFLLKPFDIDDLLSRIIHNLQS